MENQKGEKVCVEAKASDSALNEDDPQRSIDITKKFESFDSGTFLPSETSTNTLVQKLSVDDLVPGTSSTIDNISSFNNNKSSVFGTNAALLSPYKFYGNVKDPSSLNNIYSAASSESHHIATQWESESCHISTQYDSPLPLRTTVSFNKAVQSNIESDASQQVYQHLTERVQNLVEENSTNMETLRQTEDKLQYSEDQLMNKTSTISSLKSELECEKAKNKQLEEETIKLNEAKSELENESVVAQKSLKEAREALYEHASQASNLVETYRSQSEAETQDLLEKNQKLSDDNYSLKQQLIESTKLLQQLEVERKQTEGEAVKALVKAQEQIGDLLEQLDRSSDQFQVLEAEITTLKSSNQELERQNRSEIQSLQEKFNEQKQELESELERVNREFRTAENKNQDYQKRIDELVIGNLILEQDDSNQLEHSTSKRSLSDIALCFAKKDAYIKRLEAEVKEVENALHKNELLEHEISSVKRSAKSESSRLVELEALCQSLEKTSKDLTGKTSELSEKNNRLQSECDSLEARLKDRTQQLIELKEEMKVVPQMKEKLKESNEEKEKLKKETEKMKSTLDDMTAKLTEMETELSIKNQRLTSQNQQIIEFTAQHQNLTHEWTEKLKARQLVVSEQHEAMRNEVAKYREENQKLRLSVEQLGKELTTSLGEMNIMEDALSDAKLAQGSKDQHTNILLKNLQHIAENDSKRVKALEDELNACRENNAAQCLKAWNKLNFGFLRQIDDIEAGFKDTLESKNNQISELESQLHMYATSLDEENERTQELEKSLNDRKEILKQLNDQVVELQETQDKLQIKLANEQEKIGNSEKVAEELKQQYQLHCYNLQENMKEKDEKISQLVQQLRDHEEEMKSLRETIEAQDKQINDCIIENKGNEMKVEQLDFEAVETRKQLFDKIDEVEALKISIKEMALEKSKTESRCKDLETELVEIKARCEDLNRRMEIEEEKQLNRGHELSERAREVGDLNEQNRHLHEQIQEREKELFESVLQLDEQQYELSLRNEQVTRLTEQIGEFKSEKEGVIAELKVRAGEMKSQLDGRMDDISQLSQQITALQAELEQTRKKLEEKTRVESELKEQLQEEENKILKYKQLLTIKNEQLKENVEMYKEMEADCDGKIINCQQNLVKLKSTLTNLQKESTAMAALLNKKDSQISALKAENKAAENKYMKNVSSTQLDMQRLSLFYEKEREKFEKKKSRLALHQNFEVQKHSAKLKELKEEIERKNLELSTAVYKISNQEELVECLKKHISKLEDEKAERTLRVSCGSPTNLENCSVSAIMEESSGEDLSRLSAELDMENKADAPSPSGTSFCDTTEDADSSLCRRIFGPIETDEEAQIANMQSFSSLENSDQDLSSLKELQKDFIASNFRV